MEIREYIESGILETYLLGSATKDEARELERLKFKYPEIQNELHKLEMEMENLAQQMAITPPPTAWLKIEDHIVNDLIKRNNASNPTIQVHARTKEKSYSSPSQNNFIEVEGASSHMRIHKSWRWVLAAVFVLGKIFLAFAIYYFLENRQIKQELNELKLENHRK
ncbi:hypothetical protein ACXZ1K_14720 [Pedobacter sp. PWIIR3]